MSAALPVAVLPVAPGVVAPAAGDAASAAPATGFEALLAALIAPVTPGAAALVGAPATGDGTDADEGGASDAGVSAADAQAALMAMMAIQAPPPPQGQATALPADSSTATVETFAPAASPPGLALVQTLADADTAPTMSQAQAAAAPQTDPGPAPQVAPPAPSTAPPAASTLDAETAAVLASATAPRGPEADAARRSTSAPPAPRTSASPWGRSDAVSAPASGVAQATTSAGPPTPSPSPTPGLLLAVQAQSGDPGDAALADPAPAAADDGSHNLSMPAAPSGPPPTGPAASAPLPPPRVSVETVTNLAAQIARKLEERSTRFDMELQPAGLGRVGVRLEVGAHGRVTAAMSFDNPGAAAELKNRAGELARSLEQAGFDVSGGLSFDFAGGQGQAGGERAAQDRNAASTFAARAFQVALDGVTDGETLPPGALRLRRDAASGVDITI